jgi:hypothetical protein
MKTYMIFNCCVTLFCTYHTDLNINESSEIIPVSINLHYYCIQGKEPADTSGKKSHQLLYL